MANKQGISNFVANIEPIMKKCRDGVRLTKEEQKNIVEFYLETIHYINES